MFQFAVTIGLPDTSAVLLTSIEDDDADIADRDQRLWHRLDGCKQPVDVPGAFDDDLQLPPAVAAAFQEFFQAPGGIP